MLEAAQLRMTCKIVILYANARYVKCVSVGVWMHLLDPVMWILFRKINDYVSLSG